MAQERNTDVRRGLPAVSELLEEPEVRDFAARFSPALATAVVRQALAALREAAGRGRAPDRAAVKAALDAALSAEVRPRLRRVVNATGVVLHTGLGRAVLCAAAARDLALLDRPCNLQVDLAAGERGDRCAWAERMLCRLTGAGAALLVNNNAAATLLVLAALCRGREVVVSRGQLVEIGGSFRLPDCIRESGARLVEVGTTNRTRLSDYAKAIGPGTAALLRVNPSNYRVVGFAEDVATTGLVTLRRDGAPLVIDDLGCGALLDLSAHGLPKEPTVQESLAAGADIALFSADKLVGGPQAGIICGRADLVERIRREPLSRMLRVCKLTEMALERTLELFFRPERLLAEHPTLGMLAAKPDELRARGERLLGLLPAGGPLRAELVACASSTGGGTLPAVDLPSCAVALAAPGVSAGRLSRLLRLGEPPVIARVERDAVLLDLRTLMPGDDGIVAAVLGSLAPRLAAAGKDGSGD